MSNHLTETIPKSTIILAGALWAILAVLGSVILATVLSVKDTQSTMFANQVNNTRRIEKIEDKDAIQDDRLNRVEVAVARK